MDNADTGFQLKFLDYIDDIDYIEDFVPKIKFNVDMLYRISTTFFKNV